MEFIGIHWGVIGAQWESFVVSGSQCGQWLSTSISGGQCGSVGVNRGQQGLLELSGSHWGSVESHCGSVEVSGAQLGLVGLIEAHWRLIGG